MQTVGARARGRSTRERGQAGVEAVVLVPILVLVVAAAVQLVLLASAAAAVERAAVQGAQAALRGSPAEPAVRAALPAALRQRLRITQDGASLHVSVTARSFLPFLPEISLAASAS